MTLASASTAEPTVGSGIVAPKGQKSQAGITTDSQLGNGGCYFISKRCTELLPVKFSSENLPNVWSDNPPHEGTTQQGNGVKRYVQFRHYDFLGSKNQAE